MAINNTKHLLFHENPDVIKSECLFVSIVTNGGPAYIELILNGDTLSKLFGLISGGQPAIILQCMKTFTNIAMHCDEITNQGVLQKVDIINKLPMMLVYNNPKIREE